MSGVGGRLACLRRNNGEVERPLRSQNGIYLYVDSVVSAQKETHERARISLKLYRIVHRVQRGDACLVFKIEVSLCRHVLRARATRPTESSVAVA